MRAYSAFPLVFSRVVFSCLHVFIPTIIDTLLMVLKILPYAVTENSFLHYRIYLQYWCILCLSYWNFAISRHSGGIYFISVLNNFHFWCNDVCLSKKRENLIYTHQHCPAMKYILQNFWWIDFILHQELKGKKLVVIKNQLFESKK